MDKFRVKGASKEKGVWVQEYQMRLANKDAVKDELARIMDQHYEEGLLFLSFEAEHEQFDEVASINGTLQSLKDRIKNLADQVEVSNSRAEAMNARIDKAIAEMKNTTAARTQPRPISNAKKK